MYFDLSFAILDLLGSFFLFLFFFFLGGGGVGFFKWLNTNDACGVT